jgi:hypothetical protein
MTSEAFGSNSCHLIAINYLVYGELLIRQAAWHATLLHPFLYVVDLKGALIFGEAQ